MINIVFITLFLALIADWYFGEPKLLWSKIPHPVVIFGKLISFVDNRFNQETYSDDQRYRYGAIAISILIIIAIIAGNLLGFLFAMTGPLELVLNGFVVFILLAQKSLYDHVEAVAIALREEGLSGGRRAVSLIVGRDPDFLDRSNVARASIETLAENFSDGVVAPAFWYLIFGLPGILAYKMINTADSMIGHRSDKYLNFGRVSAQIDDIANWVPARLSALLIGIGALFIKGWASCKQAFLTALRDANLHRSPNAGWPESAMAGSINIALGGPRKYKNESVQQAYLNASGKTQLGADDIDEALSVYQSACFCQMGIVLILAFLI